MQRDAQGLPIAAASAEAAIAFDAATASYLAYRADTMPRVEAALAADPECGMAHCLKGALLMLGFKQALLPQAAAAAAEARRRMAARASAREHRHVDALDAWIGGDPDGAVAIWETILAAHPRDVIAFRLAHFATFWTGQPDAMLASVLRVAPHWNTAIPGHGAVLGSLCFALEECGHYTEAEAAGRRAIEADPTNLWAAHGVAHVMEMQGRRREGLAWIAALEGGWQHANNLRHHLWWHAAMFHLELGDVPAVLHLYDSGFRDLGAPLVAAAPDLYIDVQNAASMLFRLQLHGVDVGDRWEELGALAETRIGDCLSAFTLPHWMMALAATGRDAAAGRLLTAMRDYARAPGTAPALVGRYALPACEAVLALAHGRPEQAVAAMRPALGGMYRLGGSHAQQDVLEQLALHAAMRAGLDDDVRLMLERSAGRHPVPPHHRAGYRAAARQNDRWNLPA
jgi:tetratricopeptide (TPR) repeat protein